MRILIFLLAGSLTIFYSCKSPSPEKETNTNSSRNSGLRDSILKLDTLVLLNRTVNAGLSVEYARKAVKIAAKMKSPEAEMRANMIMGNAFSLTHKDSSFCYYNKSLVIAEKEQNADLKVRLLYNIAMLYNAAGENKTAMILLDSSLNLAATKKVFKHTSNIYNALGNILFELNDTIRSRLMYDSAYSIAERNSDYAGMGSALGNLIKFINNTDSTISMLNKAVLFTRKDSRAKEQLAILLTNLANRISNPDTAIKYYQNALKCVTAESSPKTVIMIYNNMAYSYLVKGDHDNAEACLEEHAIPLASKHKDYEWLWVVYDSYADVLTDEKKTGEAIKYEKKAVEYLQRYNTESASKQICLLAAILDLRKKETIILNSAVEIQTANAALKSKRILILIILLSSICVIGFILFLFLRKKIKYQQAVITSARKLIKAEEYEKAKISREIHDMTGFQFADLNELISSTPFTDEERKNQISKGLDNVRQIIRDISHRMSPSWLAGLSLKKNIQGLCIDCQKSGVLNVTLNYDEKIPELKDEERLHIFRIIQELISNAIKYASGADVRISLIMKMNNLIITYKDNGPGFNYKSVMNHGMGISNIQERISLMKGTVSMKSNADTGTVYYFEIPLI